jgi:hypothetical protein
MNIACRVTRVTVTPRRHARVSRDAHGGVWGGSVTRHTNWSATLGIVEGHPGIGAVPARRETTFTDMPVTEKDHLSSIGPPRLVHTQAESRHFAAKIINSQRVTYPIALLGGCT